MVRDARARSGPVLWFTPGGLCSGLWLCARMAGSSIGGAGGARSAPAASPGGLWGVMLPCCDDRSERGVRGASGLRTAGGGEVIAAGFRCGRGGWLRAGAGAGGPGCRFRGSCTGRDRLVTR